MDADRLSEHEFWELLAVGQRHLVRYAHSFTSDRMAAEDIVAEAAMSVLKAIQRGGGPTRQTFISYLRVSVRNESINAARAASREQATAHIDELIESQQDTEFEVLSATTWDAETAVRAFQTLPKKTQNLLMLAEIQEKKLAEVGEIMGMSTRAVATATYRARDALRTNYLIESAAAEDSCVSMKLPHLAAYVRGTSPELRRNRVQKHLDDCERCTRRVQKMMSLKLPTLAVVGLAVGGTILGSGYGTHPAAAVTPEQVDAQTAILLKAKRRKFGLKFSSLALLLIAIGSLLVLTPQSKEQATESDTTRLTDSSQQTREGTVQTTTPGSPAEEGQKTDADARSGVQTPVPARPTMPSPSGGLPPGEIPPGEVPPGVVPPGELPPGVRSANWVDTPPEYTSGASNVRLFLSIVFDSQTAASDYVVDVTSPQGVTITDASASCSVGALGARCVPTAGMLELRAFNFQYVVDTIGNVPLPTFALSRR